MDASALLIRHTERLFHEHLLGNDGGRIPSLQYDRLAVTLSTRGMFHPLVDGSGIGNGFRADILRRERKIRTELNISLVHESGLHIGSYDAVLIRHSGLGIIHSFRTIILRTGIQLIETKR